MRVTIVNNSNRWRDNKGAKSGEVETIPPTLTALQTLLWVDLQLGIKKLYNQAKTKETINSSSSHHRCQKPFTT